MATNSTASGLPTTGAVGSDAPLPIQDFGNIASVNPTYAQYASQVAPSQAQAATADPYATYQQQQMAYNQNATTLAPQFAQQQSQLQDSSAARGISSSGAAGYLQGNLQGQQAGALASADAPITEQAMAYGQQDVQSNQANQQATNFANQQADIGAGEFNSGQQQGVNLANQTAANQGATQNAGYYNAALGSNAANYNDYLGTIEGQGYNTGNEAYGAYLGSFEPNSGVQTSINNAESAGTSGYNNAYGAATQGQSGLLGGLGGSLGGLFGGSGAAAGGGPVVDTSFEDAPYIL